MPFQEWVAEAWQVVVNGMPQPCGWNLCGPTAANATASFKFLDVYANYTRSPGPILLVGQLQYRDVRQLREKIAGRVVILECATPSGSTDVYESVLDVIQRHDRGEPEIPTRLAVALMLVAKLEHMHYWGGNAKGFLTVSDLAKGNGLDEKYRSMAHEVADYLAVNAPIALLSKKTGDRYPKYACNNVDRSIVYEFLRTRQVPNVQMMNWLNAGTGYVVARELEHITPERYVASR